MTQSTTEVPRIDSTELQHQQRSGRPLHIIDVRRGSYRNSPVKIQDAQRVEPDDLLMAEHVELPVAKDALVVTYCT